MKIFLIGRYVEINAELANQNRAFYSLGCFASLFPDFSGCAKSGYGPSPGHGAPVLDPKRCFLFCFCAGLEGRDEHCPECLPEKVLLSQHIQTLLEDSQDQGTLETADIM